MKSISLLLSLIALLISSVTFAKGSTQTSAVMSPGCDQQKIKDLAGNAFVKISKKQQWDGTEGYIVTLKKLDHKDAFLGLTEKMASAGCYQKKK